VRDNSRLTGKRGITPSLSVEAPMEITEVRITLTNEEKLKAFANITFDASFVVRGLKVISGAQGYFISMPSRRRKDGSFQDLAHPVTNELRKKIEEKVLDAFEAAVNRAGVAPAAATVVEDNEHPVENT
jgi:stage V sporulation protein G